MATKTSHSVEDQFVLRLLSKERSAFEELYDRYSDALYGVLLRILNNEELAADVLQETYVKVWKKIHTYDRSKGRIFTWILNIARNRAIDILRSAHHQKTAQGISAESLSDTQYEKTEEIRVEHIGVRDMLASLSPEQREIIDYLYFKGFTQAETAQKLELPLGTVKSRARLAMQNLKKNYADG